MAFLFQSFNMVNYIHCVSMSSQPCIPEVNPTWYCQGSKVCCLLSGRGQICLPTGKQQGQASHTQSSDSCCRGTSPECMSLPQGQQAPSADAWPLGGVHPCAAGGTAPPGMAQTQRGLARCNGVHPLKQNKGAH